MNASKQVPIILLIFLAGCAVTPTRTPDPIAATDSRIDGVSESKPTPSPLRADILPSPPGSPTSLPTVQNSEKTNNVKHDVITKDNILKLGLLHDWDVDEVRGGLWQADNRLWFDDGSQFFMNIENYGNFGIQTFKIIDNSIGWFAFTDYAIATMGEDNQILAYQWGITIIDDQGKVIQQIYDDGTCSEYYANQVIAVPNSSFVITGHQEDKEFFEGYGTSRIRIWDINNNTCREFLETPGLIESMDVDNVGHYLSYSVIRSAFDPAKEDYKIWIETIMYDLHLDQEVCSMENVGDVLFTPQNQLMVFQRFDYTFLILNPDNCSVVNQLNLDINTYRDIQIPSFTISPDGELLVVMAGGKIQIIDMFNGELIHEVAVDLIGNEPLQIVDFSPDGKFIVGARNKNYEDVKGHILLFGFVEK